VAQVKLYQFNLPFSETLSQVYNQSFVAKKRKKQEQEHF